MRMSVAARLLLVLNLLLAAALAWLWFGADGRLREERIRWRAPGAQGTDVAGMIPVMSGSAAVDGTRYLAVLERPLFALSRRPPVPEPVVVVAPPAPPAPPPPPDHLSSARLHAIIDIPGQGGIVILTVAGKTRRVALDTVVEGWTAKSIDGRNVTFTRNGQSRTLQLQRAALTGGGAPEAASAGQPPGRRGGPASSRTALDARSSPPAESTAAADGAQGAAPAQPPSSSEPRRAVFGGSGRR